MRVFKISFPCDMEWTEGEDFSRMKGALNVPLMFKLRISSDLRVKKKKKAALVDCLLVRHWGHWLARLHYGVP